MVQHIIILILFLAAAFYVGRLLYQTFSSSGSSCPKGCGSCSAIDIKKIEVDIRKRQDLLTQDLPK